MDFPCYMTTYVGGWVFNFDNDIGEWEIISITFFNWTYTHSFIYEIESYNAIRSKTHKSNAISLMWGVCIFENY